MCEYVKRREAAAEITHGSPVASARGSEMSPRVRPESGLAICATSMPQNAEILRKSLSSAQTRVNYSLNKFDQSLHLLAVSTVFSQRYAHLQLIVHPPVWALSHFRI